MIRDRLDHRSHMRTRGGFAALLAILLLLLIGSILAALATMSAADARRVRSHHAEAQLSQLLTAGAAIACREMENPSTPAADQVIPLPAEPASQQAGLKLNFQSPNARGHVQVTVAAHLNNRRLEQTLDFAPVTQPGKHWKLESAKLLSGPSVR